MRRRRAAASYRAVALAAVAGCLGCAPGRWMEPAQGQPECGPATEVGSSEELIRLLDQRAVEPPSSEVTGDLVATADLVLTPEDLGLAGCVACLPQLNIPGSRVRPGILASADGYEIRTGAAFRVLVEAVESKPGQPLTRLWIRSPCGTPCPEGQRRCPADEVCYPDGEPLCMACTDLPPERCACAGPDGSILETGSGCAVFDPGDGAIQPGVCRKGSCRSDTP